VSAHRRPEYAEEVRDLLDGLVAAGVVELLGERGLVCDLDWLTA
jgi:hypothetical protein